MTPKWQRLEPLLRRGKWNFVQVVDAIIESSLTRAEKITLIAIATHRGGARQAPSPGLRRLASLTSQKVDTTADAVDSLERKGVLRVDRRHRQAHVYDLSGTMRGLLAVPPNGTAAVPKEDTGAVPPIGTEERPPEPASCPDRGSELSRSGGSNCPDPAYPRDQEGTIEGTIERASQSSAPTTVEVHRSTTKTRKPQRLKPKKPKPWTFVPEDWTPMDHHRELARKHGRDFDREVTKFRNHEFKSPKTDADRAFTNWLTNDFGLSSGNGRLPKTQGGAADVKRLAAKNEELRKLRGLPSLED